tara:strand:- start:1346 stop:1738 length:393 start_codon:yes stop_codon:yes gene_type:complete
MKKERLQELAGIKKPLNEANMWDRNEDGSMPTLADTTARYAAMKGESLDEVQGGDEEALKSAILTSDTDLIDNLEQGYYDMSDGLGETIKALTSILRETAPEGKNEIKAELDLYVACEKLMLKSLIGKLL